MCDTLTLNAQTAKSSIVGGSSTYFRLNSFKGLKQMQPCCMKGCGGGLLTQGKHEDRVLPSQTGKKGTKSMPMQLALLHFDCSHPQ